MCFDDGVWCSDVLVKKFEMVNVIYLFLYVLDGFLIKFMWVYARLVITSLIGVTTRSRFKVVVIFFCNFGDCVFVIVMCVELLFEYIFSLLSVFM